jgi:flagellar motor switch protein FliN/FliY
MDDLTNEEVEELSKVMGDDSTVQASSDVIVEEQSPAPSHTPSGDHEAPANSNIARAQFMQLEELAEAAELPATEMSRMHDIQVKVEAVLGRSRLTLEEILHLHPGSVLELNRLAGEPVDIIANERLIARAEVVVVDDRFGIKILEIVGSQPKLAGPAK